MGHERHDRGPDRGGRLHGGALLPRGHRRPPSFPRHAHPPPAAHKSIQPRPRPGGTRSVAARGGTGRRPQAGRCLVDRPSEQRHRVPAHRPGRAARGAASMILGPPLDVALAVLVLPLAVWTIAARETFVAVISFIAYGLLLTLVWVRLAAPDVALTVAAIGSGLAGVLLLGAAARLRGVERLAAAGRPRLAVRVTAAVVSGMVAAGLAAAVISLRGAAPTLAPRVAANLQRVGVGNPVTGVLMAFRAMDTLLEKVVLLLALVAVWSLAPGRLWGGRPGPRHQADPHGALAFLARLLPPVGIVVGIYLLWVSADEPGGAFPGSTVIAAMWLLIAMAGLTDTPPVSRRWLRIVLVAGPALFLAVGLGGLWLGAAFLAYPESYAKPVIIVSEIGMLLTVAATLGLLMAGAPERRAGP